MRQQLKLYLLAFSFVLGLTSKGFGRDRRLYYD